MRFRFRAEAALRLRRDREQRALTIQARAFAARDAAGSAVQVATAAHDDALRQAARAEAVETGAFALDWHRNWILVLQRQVARCEQDLTACRERADSATRAVQAAHRDVRVLERLRERRLSEFTRAEMRHEQQMIDGLATTRYLVNRRSKEDP
jgi:flagellar export protein FliJ